MSVRTVLQRSEPPLVWLDIVQPTAAELEEVARTHGLQPTSVKDCLDPEHLPKFEQFENYTFVIIRAFDEQSEQTCATVQELTRKVAIFSGQGFLITIHRTELPWLAAVEARFQGEAGGNAGKPGKEGLQVWALTQVLNAAVDTYLRPMERIEERIDAFEELIFNVRESDSRAFAEDLRDIHVLKRQVTLIKRLLWRTLDVVQRMTPAQRARGDAVPGRPGERRELPLLCRRAARRRQHRAQRPARAGRAPDRRGHAHPHRVLRVLPAAHLPGGRLRHELRLHARAPVALGLPGGARGHGARSSWPSTSGSAGAAGCASEPAAGRSRGDGRRRGRAGCSRGGGWGSRWRQASDRTCSPIPRSSGCGARTAHRGSGSRSSTRARKARTPSGSWTRSASR